MAGEKQLTCSRGSSLLPAPCPPCHVLCSPRAWPAARRVREGNFSRQPRQRSGSSRAANGTRSAQGWGWAADPPCLSPSLLPVPSLSPVISGWEEASHTHPFFLVPPFPVFLPCDHALPPACFGIPKALSRSYNHSSLKTPAQTTRVGRPAALGCGAQETLHPGPTEVFIPLLPVGKLRHGWRVQLCPDLPGPLQNQVQEPWALGEDATRHLQSWLGPTVPLDTPLLPGVPGSPQKATPPCQPGLVRASSSEPRGSRARREQLGSAGPRAGARPGS